MKKRIISIILSCSMMMTLFVPAAYVKAEDSSEGTQEYIVQLENTDTVQNILDEAVLEDTAEKELKNQEIVVLELTEDEARRLDQRKDIVNVEENIILNGSGNTEDNEVTDTAKQKKKFVEKKADFRSKQWNLDAIHMPESKENAGKIRIGILDSGVSFSEDVNVAQKVSLIDETKEADVLFDDLTGHGTGIAGIIAAQDNEEGITGINPGAEIYSIHILDENNQATLSKVVAGIYEAIDAGCKIINMSFGTPVDSEVLHNAVKDAHEKGILMIAAAGNTKGGQVEYPAAYEEVMAVGASDIMGNKDEETSDGSEIEIFAPGNQVPVTGLFDGVAVVNGTSISTAQVTGAASVLWEMNESKSAEFIRGLLKNTAQTMQESGVSGSGLLDIENAVQSYEEFESAYTEGENTEPIAEERREAESFENIELVNGLWGNKNHQNLAYNAADGENIDARYVKLMALSAHMPDESAYNELRAFHATGNYVLYLRFLYSCAKKVRDGMSVEEAVNLAASRTGISESDAPKLFTYTKKMLNDTFTDASIEHTPQGRFYKTMGIAMHLIGDTFAHRTIVPKHMVDATVAKEPVYSSKSGSKTVRFGSADFKTGGTLESDAKIKSWAKSSASKSSDICKHWKCFKRGVEPGVMEFKDIKNFGTTATAGKYEDNIDFGRERYADADQVCSAMFTELMDNETFDGAYILFPVEKYVVLNNFKAYCKEAKTPTSGYTDAEWNKVSTPEFY